MSREIKRIVLHHDGGIFDRCKYFLEGIRDVSRGEGYEGYHFIIGNKGILNRDGQIYSGRAIETSGRYTPADALGVCLLGNFDKEHPSDKQRATLVECLLELCTRNNLTEKDILGHRELPGARTTCPGRRINMNEIRGEIGNHLFAHSLPHDDIQYKIPGERK